MYRKRYKGVFDGWAGNVAIMIWQLFHNVLWNNSRKAGYYREFPSLRAGIIDKFEGK